MANGNKIETNILYCDDNLKRLAQLPEKSVDLIYLDPPFFSNRNYEVIWGDEAETRSFEDRWKGGIEHYTEWMKQRIREMHRVLKDTGSLYLHCDWHAGHYLKVMLDEIFGDGNFQNEIVWCYRTGGATKKRWSRKHDTIFFYTKSDKWTFNCEKERIFYEKAFFVSQQDEQGRYYADVLPVDWWTIPAVINVSKERVGYPTQKPEALLERIIKASSNKGDVVLDPFCGCGTTLAVAEKLNRRWIGIDISPSAIALVKERLAKIMDISKVKDEGMPHTVDDAKKMTHFDFQLWIVREFFHGVGSNKMSGDMGIDGWSYLEHLPIQVKQSEHIGRNIVDNFETAMERAKKSKGYIVAFSFGSGAYEEAARCKREKGLEIELVTVEELLKKRAG